MIETFIFILGACIASFVMAMTYRADKEEKIKKTLTSRSHCDNCKKNLRWFELIPIFSYIIFLGRCPRCKKKIPFIYTLGEILLGISFVIIYKTYLFNIWYYLFASILLSLSFFDYISKSIPQKLAHILLGLGGVFFIFNYSPIRLQSILIAVVVVAVIFLINKYKKSFGLGDIFLILFFSLIYTPSYFVTFLLLTLYLAAFFGLIMILKNRKNIKSYIPLIPFMFISFITTPLIHQYFIEYVLPLW